MNRIQSLRYCLTAQMWVYLGYVRCLLTLTSHYRIIAILFVCEPLVQERRKKIRFLMDIEVFNMKSISKDKSRQFNTLYLALHKKFRDTAYADALNKGFTVPQLTLIYELHQEPNLTLQELADRLGLAKSTTSSLVDRMVSRGIVTRETPDNNRRIVYLALTPHFTSQNQNLLSAKDHIISDVFNFHMVTDQQADEIIKTLNMLLSLLSNADDASNIT